MQRGHNGGRLLGEAYGQDVRQVLQYMHMCFASHCLAAPARGPSYANSLKCAYDLQGSFLQSAPLSKISP